MEEVIVISEFREAGDWSVLHRAGESLLVEPRRAAELLSLGLCRRPEPRLEAGEPKPSEAAKPSEAPRRWRESKETKARGKS